MQITSARYWRENKFWGDWLGKIGIVIVSSQLHVAPPGQEEFLPYSFVLVNFGKQNKELMGIPGEIFETGDKVECVFRKLDIPDEKGIIHYGIKVKKI